MVPRLLSVCLALVVALAPLGTRLYAQTEAAVVVVHPESEIDSVTRVELSNIFLKRLRTWEDGQVAIPVDQLPENPVRAVFSKRIHQRSVVGIEVFWKRMIFSGRSVPPREYASDAEVLDFVRQTPGAVGYVGSLADVDGVKILSIKNGQ